MKYILILIMTSISFAFTPSQVQRSVGELRVDSAFALEMSDADKLLIGEQLLNEFADDIPAGRTVQQQIGKLLTDKVAYFKSRYDEQPSLSSFYLYARATDFQLADSVVAKVVDENPDSFWAWLMYMATEWHKENPDMNVVLDRVQTAVSLDPTRPEGFDFLATAYTDMSRMSDARAAYEAGLICDPANSAFKNTLLDIYLVERDADAYFRLVNGMLPAEPVEVDLASVHSAEIPAPVNLEGSVSLLIYWTRGSDICINSTLVELNSALHDQDLDYPVYAMQLGNMENSLIGEADKRGRKWKVQFMQGSQDLDKQLGLPSRPCVYVIGEDGFVHAIMQGNGHKQDLVDTVVWLAEQVKKGM